MTSRKKARVRVPALRTLLAPQSRVMWQKLFDLFNLPLRRVPAMLELDMAVALESQGSDRILPKLARHWQSHQELPSVLRGHRRHRSGRTGRRKHQVEALDLNWSRRAEASHRACARAAVTAKSAAIGGVIAPRAQQRLDETQRGLACATPCSTLLGTARKKAGKPPRPFQRMVRDHVTDVSWW